MRIARCGTCRVAIYSHYAGTGDKVAFIRVGTLDDPSPFAPQAHIFTSSKQPWLVFPEGANVFAEYYDMKTLWPADSLARRKALLG